MTFVVGLAPVGSRSMFLATLFAALIAAGSARPELAAGGCVGWRA